MVQKKTVERINLDEHQLYYHKKQWGEHKNSTLVFCSFVKYQLIELSCLIDLGAGAGAAKSYISKKTPKSSIIAADYIIEFLESGKTFTKDDGLYNLTFQQVDWFHLQEANKICRCNLIGEIY